ncbi:MAG: 30S ribosomal protein S15 [bacterium]|nr:30S ribosomal protein S15 [bacterium]
MLTKRQKNRVIGETKVHDTDTGSPEVQIGLLTRRIEELTDHLKKHQKDKHSRRGLLQMVANRQTLVKYLQKKSARRYNAIAKKLNLRKREK